MKIGFVTHGIGTQGGIESVVHHLVTETVRRGHQAVVFCARPPVKPVKGVTVVVVRVPRLPYALWHLVFAYKSAKAAARHPVDLLQAHVNTFARVDMSVCHSVHAAGSKVVAALDPNLLRRAWHWVKSVAPLLNWLAGINYRNPGLKVAVATSRGIAVELLQRYPGLKEKMVVIPNGIDPRFRRPASAARRRRLRIKAGLKPKDRALLFIGKEFHRKGLEPILRALPLLPETVSLWVVGNNVDAVPTRHFTALVESLGLGSRVRFLGHQKDLLSFYQAADAFVFPTLYEAFAMVSIESMACALPLLACEANGTEDLIQPGRNGAFVERDGSSIAAVVRRWIVPEAKRRRLAKGAFATSRDYHWSKIFARQLAAGRAALAGKKLPDSRWSLPRRLRS